MLSKIIVGQCILKPMITSIVFDFYGVFVNDPYDAWLATHNIERSGPYSDLVHQVDTGKLSHEDFFIQLGRLSGKSVESIRDSFIITPALINSDMVTLVKQLSQSYKLGFISNGSHHVRELLESQSLVDHFQSIVISSEVGITKPSREIFERCFIELDATGDEIVFIDDRTINTEAAAHLGVLTLVYKSYDELVPQLQELLAQ